MNRPTSLQSRLLVWVLGLVVLVWVLTAVVTWLDTSHELDELLDSHLAQAAALLVVQQDHEQDEDDHVTETPSLHRYVPRAAFQIFHGGRLTQRSLNAPLAPMFETTGDDQSGFRTVSFDGAIWRVFVTTGADRNIRVFVGEQVKSRNQVLLAVLRSSMWPMLAALPLLALAVWWAVRRGVLPFRRLSEVLGERSPQELRPVVVEGAPAEMVSALDALNGLLQRIATLVESERRFTADAAHELRTPIAAIRAQAQVALGAADAGQRRHALQATLAGCDRATRLVQQLLTLARLEASASAAVADVDLGDLARGVVAELAPRAIDKHQDLALIAEGRFVVQGDATLLAVLLRNLVDNAIRYSPAHAAVKVELSNTPHGVVVHVEDSGPGMTADDLHRVGERFFRVTGTGQDGSGLGWSIIRRIASAHRGEIRLDCSQALGGLSVDIELRAKDAPGAPAA